jgi:hypothetical protein
MPVVVLTVDQRDSSRTADAVPGALDALAAVPVLRGFERTAGDELQGVLDDPAAVTTVLEWLLRAEQWNVGLGLDEVDQPLPDSTRAGRGPAYLRAREAVTSAKSALWRLQVRGADERGARALETTLWLWAALLSRRTARGWEVADLVDEGLRYDEVAARLEISQSAVSQRAAAAGIVESRRARELVTGMLGALLAGREVVA